MSIVHVYEITVKGQTWIIDLEHKQLILKNNPNETRKMEGEDEIDHFRSIVRGG